MTRPTVEVADIFRAQAKSFIDRHRHWLRFQQLKVMRAITRCRTAALGGHIDKCVQQTCRNGCGNAEDTISFNSCRDRHCPKCQAQARQRWIAARQQELLETSYFHVVFTLPHDLHALIRQNAVELYNLLFRAVAETLMEVAANPQHLGAEIGFFAILHTWGQNLLFHPHIHCVVPSGGFASDRTRWIHHSGTFFLPIDVLKPVFRGKFIDGLRDAFRLKRLSMEGQIQHLATPRSFAAFLRKLHRHEWVAYAKPSFGGPEQVLRYLGRYTHRVAISNHRLISFDGESVTFRWRDYAHGNKKRQMTVSAEEFIRRFLMHVLPKGFVRIRHFGFMANYQRTASLDLCRKLLGMAPVDRSTTIASTPGRLCPRCGAAMIVVQRLNAAQIRWKFVPTCVADTS
jgi:Putative transposase/Transposase zinc-binding domain